MSSRVYNFINYNFKHFHIKEQIYVRAGSSKTSWNVRFKLEGFSYIAGIYTARRNRLNAPSAAKDFARAGHWLSTKSCTWRNRRTNVPSAREALIRGATWRLIFLRTQILSLIIAPPAARFSAGIVIWGDTRWLTIWEYRRRRRHREYRFPVRAPLFFRRRLNDADIDSSFRSSGQNLLYIVRAFFFLQRRGSTSIYYNAATVLTWTCDRFRRSIRSTDSRSTDAARISISCAYSSLRLTSYLFACTIYHR